MKAKLILTGEISSMFHIKRNFFDTDAEFYAVRNHFTAEFETVKDAQQALRIAGANLRRYCDGEATQPDIYRRHGRIESISYDAANVQIFRT